MHSSAHEVRGDKEKTNIAVFETTLSRKLPQSCCHQSSISLDTAAIRFLSHSSRADCVSLKLDNHVDPSAPRKQIVALFKLRHTSSNDKLQTWGCDCCLVLQSSDWEWLLACVTPPLLRHLAMRWRRRPLASQACKHMSEFKMDGSRRCVEPERVLLFSPSRFGNIACLSNLHLENDKEHFGTVETELLFFFVNSRHYKICIVHLHRNLQGFILCSHVLSSILPGYYSYKLQKVSKSVTLSSSSTCCLRNFCINELT